MPAEWREQAVARVAEIPPGGRQLVQVDGRVIGVFRLRGDAAGDRFVAVRNVCPHEGAPVCLGRLGGTTLPSPPGVYRWGREGEILTCPWHGWEFDLLTGAALATPSVRLGLYPVAVRDGTVYVRVRRAAGKDRPPDPERRADSLARAVHRDAGGR